MLSCLLGVAVTLAAHAGLARDARADYYLYDWSQVITQRYRVFTTPTGTHSGTERAFKGPSVVVRGWTTNTDTYECPANQSVTNWMAVADDPFSATLSFTSTSTAVLASPFGDSYLVTTTNWSSGHVNLRVISSCTNNLIAYPYQTKSLTDYIEDWVDGLYGGTPGWDALVRQAFGWGSVASQSTSAPARARRADNRFALHNGTNRLALRFSHPGHSRRPPAIYLATSPAKADCRARRLHVPVIDGSGAALLELRCRGLKRGATARLAIRKGIRRIFPLDEGRGTVRVRLDKPPGTVEALVHLSTRPDNVPCRTLRHRLRLTRRTMDLRLDGRCGRGAHGAVGALYVGGLLAADGRASGGGDDR